MKSKSSSNTSRTADASQQAAPSADASEPQKLGADQTSPDPPVEDSSQNVPAEVPPAKETRLTTKASSSEPHSDSFPIVGIGASAGGLEALEEFFSHMPLDSGMAYVVVTHQHPGHTSMLAELLSRKTALPVVEISERIAMERNHVYVAPPGGYLDILNGVVFRMDETKPESPHLPIDHFLRSLATDQTEKAICIILSGTGSDGTLGMRAIKGQGGMAMVQQVETAKYSGMPSSAIAEGIADFVLPPAAMPAQLVSYAQSSSQGTVTAERKPQLLSDSMRKIFVLLRARTGHDFSTYKTSTVSRRIERRLNIHSIKDPSQYVRFLQENPHELDILFKELLISVTSFFRDPDAYESLSKTLLPQMLRALPKDANVRAWVAGCATGEEAYSIAILLRECMAAIPLASNVQVFATDLDGPAIEMARLGRYPEGIAADLGPDRLKQFFDHENSTYRIHKNIREMVVFAVQNVIKDPPFTKLDFISCRNLLIYLNADSQKNLLPVFHYALKPGGLLFLGPSESIGIFSDLFEVVDKKWKIYRRKETTSAIHRFIDFPIQYAGAHDGQSRTLTSQTLGKARSAGIASLVDQLLLARFAPASVLVNSHGEILFFHGRTGDFLEPAAGQARLNLYDMAREGLKLELSSALRQAVGGQAAVAKREGVRIRNNDDYIYVDLSVHRITEPEALDGLFLVAFQPCPERLESAEATRDDTDHGQTLELERELLHTKEYLRTTIEELETSNEELKSTNEELQSTNEELQSSNEELETSKEEMQSLNEELTTVNTELSSKIEDLTRANNDMQNLLNSTEIATIFLDNELKVKRFTDEAKILVKLIPGDVGRPLADLASNLDYDNLMADGREVLRTLASKTTEVQNKDGRWYLMRMMPYRTAANVIEGVVLTFVDIHRVKTAERELAKVKEHLAADLAAMTRLHQIGSLFVQEGVTATIFEEVVDVAISINNADMGQLQRIDPSTGKLKVMEQRGFKRSWLKEWESTEFDHGAFGQALQQGKRMTVDSVAESPLLADAPILDGLLEADVQSMQCTPLISHTGKIFGIITTCHKTPHQTNDRAIRLLDLLAHLTAEILERAQRDLDTSTSGEGS